MEYYLYIYLVAIKFEVKNYFNDQNNKLKYFCVNFHPSLLILKMYR